MSTGVSGVVIRSCMGPDELSPWGVRGVIGIVVSIDGSSNRQSSTFRILLNHSALAASQFWRLTRVQDRRFFLRPGFKEGGQFGIGLPDSHLFLSSGSPFEKNSS